MSATSSPTIKGDNTVLFGANGVYSGAGIITRGSKKTGGSVLEVKDENSFTVTKIYFDDKNECEFEMIVKTAAPDLARGDFITICGVAACLVDETEEMWEQGGVRKFRVKATKHAMIDD